MDTDLVLRAQQGDRGAFAQIADGMLDRFLAIAHRVLRDGALAEDATQHSIVEMWRNLPKLREPEKLESWAHRIVVNACRREGRKANRWMQAITRTPEEDPVAAQGFATVAHRDQLERGFRRLPARGEVGVDQVGRDLAQHQVGADDLYRGARRVQGQGLAQAVDGDAQGP